MMACLRSTSRQARWHARLMSQRSVVLSNVVKRDVLSRGGQDGDGPGTVSGYTIETEYCQW